jgi:ABC-2 type transport system ATP-binding protein
MLNIIEIDHLSKYYGKSKGIEDISLEVKEGDIFGFIGPNGAGKSTTIRILMNLIFPTSGTARILGMDAVKESVKIRRSVGFVPSEANLYDKMSVLEFLRYCADLHTVENATPRINELTDYFELDPLRMMNDLSTGNKKKVSIVQSLIHRPKLLILDEPTTGLDPLVKSKLFELLHKENSEGATVFFSSHVLSEVQAFCRTVAIVKDGRIINTEDIHSLRKKQLKKITVDFGVETSIESLNLGGIESVECGKGTELTFMISGDINFLVQKLSGIKVKNLSIEDPPLDEIFLHYYQKNQDQR